MNHLWNIGSLTKLKNSLLGQGMLDQMQRMGKGGGVMHQTPTGHLGTFTKHKITRVHFPDMTLCVL